MCSPQTGPACRGRRGVRVREGEGRSQAEWTAGGRRFWVQVLIDEAWQHDGYKCPWTVVHRGHWYGLGPQETFCIHSHTLSLTHTHTRATIYIYLSIYTKDWKRRPKSHLLPTVYPCLCVCAILEVRKKLGQLCQRKLVTVRIFYQQKGCRTVRRQPETWVWHSLVSVCNKHYWAWQALKEHCFGKSSWSTHVKRMDGTIRELWNCLAACMWRQNCSFEMLNFHV